MSNDIALKYLYETLSAQESTLEYINSVKDPSKNLDLPVFETGIEFTRRTIHCIEKKQPFIQCWYVHAPELIVAMGLHFYSTSTATFSEFNKEHQLQIVAESDQLTLPTDICTLQRLMLGAAVLGKVPVPTASISLIIPCDGIPLFHQALGQIKAWQDIPTFVSDAPYRNDGEAVDYYTNQIKQMVPFLEEHTGKRMDLDHLKEVIKESNKHYELWQEVNELRRMKPCPHRSFLGMAIWNMVQTNPVTVGQPVTTQYISALVEDAEEKVKQTKGWINDEKLRILWYDVVPLWARELSRWLEKELNAVIVMDLYSSSHYTLIDPSTEESIFRGLALRSLHETPMIRMSHGTIDTMMSDIERQVTDYKIDFVIGPGHMGHKDAAAGYGILKEVCKNLGVPLLYFNYDLFDIRYTPMDEIKNRIMQFVETMGLV